jgi:hypothetical protein
MRIAILNQALTAIETYPAQRDDVAAVYPRLTLGSEMIDASLEDWPRLILVRDTEKPAANFGETVEEQVPTFEAGAWRQAWRKQRITLAEAKTMLRRMAAELFQAKVTSPNPNQLITLGYVGAIQARNDRFKPDLDSVVARIADATTIDEAFAIYQELEAAQ